MFEAIQQVKIANADRLRRSPGRKFTGSSYDDNELKANPNLSIDYVVAVPRMALYIEYSTRIYDVYLKYVAPEDIHVYSIDEVFIDATNYLDMLKISAHDFARMIIKDVLATTGVTATAGIGTNLFLCKVAMDITAKHKVLISKPVTRLGDRLFFILNCIIFKINHKKKISNTNH